MISNRFIKGNITRTRKTSQENNNGFLLPDRNIIQNDNFFEDLSRSELGTLDLFISFDNKYDSIHFSQESLAEMAFGGSRGHANRIVKTLCRWGLIRKIRRFKNTCLYKISPYFRSPEIRNKLKKYLPSLSIFPFTLSLAIIVPVKKVTLYKGIDIYNNHLYEEKGTRMSKVLNSYPSMQNKAQIEEIPDKKPLESTAERMDRIQTGQQITALEAEYRRIQLNKKLQEKHASMPVKNRWLDQFPPPAYTFEEDEKLKGEV